MTGLLLSKINKSLLNWFETNENAENIADFYQKIVMIGKKIRYKKPIYA